MTLTEIFPPLPCDDRGLPDLDALPPMDVAARADRLRAALRARREGGGRAQALLLTNLTNIRYLTGFSGSAARVLITDDALVFVTDGRYASQAPDQLGEAGIDARLEVLTTAAEQDRALAAAVAASGITVLGLEDDHVSWAAMRGYVDTFVGVDLEPVDGLVEELRIDKDAGEVARIEAAAMIADAALARVRHRLTEAPTEEAFALELDTEIRRLGAPGNSFPTICGSGPNGALPHMHPTGRVIAEGDLVVVDFGAVIDGYCSDMTRTFAVGEPSATQRRMLEVVLEAQAAGVARVADGVAAADVDAACREVIAAAGWGDAFIHGTGHGVGLDIHEAPRVATTSEAVLRSSQIVTVEPGVYLPEHGGVRIEDTLVVTSDGARALTHTDKATAPTV